jgi:hypothetical protein
VPVIIVAHQSLPESVLIEGAQISRGFHLTHNARLALRGGLLGDFLKWVGSFGLSTKTEKTSLKKAISIFYEDIESAFKHFLITNRDVVFIHSESTQLTAALIKSWMNLPCEKRPELHIRILRVDLILDDPTGVYRRLSQLMSREKIYIYTEMEKQKALLNERIFRDNQINLLRIVETSESLGQSKKKRSGRKGTPIAVTFFGRPRAEKGFNRLPNIIELTNRLCKKNGLLNPVFTIQAEEANPQLAVQTKSIKKKLRAMGAKLIEQPLSVDEYLELINESDLAVLPYDQDAYAMRGSGIALECYAHGLPMVVSGGTTLVELSDRQGSFTAFSDQDFAESILAFNRDRQSYAFNAITMAGCANDWFSESGLPYLRSMSVSNKLENFYYRDG